MRQLKLVIPLSLFNILFVSNDSRWNAHVTFLDYNWWSHTGINMKTDTNIGNSININPTTYYYPVYPNLGLKQVYTIFLMQSYRCLLSNCETIFNPSSISWTVTTRISGRQLRISLLFITSKHVRYWTKLATVPSSEVKQGMTYSYLGSMTFWLLVK